MPAVADAGIALDDIDALVVNTITGLAIPSLDAMLMNRLDFRATSSGCRSSGSAAAAASPGWRARRAWRRPCRARTCCS